MKIFKGSLVWLLGPLLFAPFMYIGLVVAILFFFVPLLQIKFYLQSGSWKSYSVVDFLQQSDTFYAWASSPQSYLGVHKILHWFSPIGFIAILGILIFILIVNLSQDPQKSNSDEYVSLFGPRPKEEATSIVKSFWDDFPEIDDNKLSGKIFFTLTTLVAIIPLFPLITSTLIFFK